MDGEIFEYVGECCICNEPVDIDDMGNCDFCGGVFHWGNCGSWHEWKSKHQCESCREYEEKKASA